MKIFKPGQTVFYAISEFDGQKIEKGIITEVNEDHIIMKTSEGITYWLEPENPIYDNIEEAANYLNLMQPERQIEIEHIKKILMNE